MSRVTATPNRPRRTSINGTRNVLSVEGKDPGYVYRVVNDTGDRVAQMESIGYEIVQDQNIRVGDRRVANPTKEGSPVKVSVGGGIQGYVMRIKKDFYEEDQSAKQDYLNKLEESLKPTKGGDLQGSVKISRD